MVSWDPFRYVCVNFVLLPILTMMGSGGGNQLNVNLKLGKTSGLWMSYEAISSGLQMRPTKVDWDWQNLGNVKESLTPVWRIFEWIPFKRLSYKDSSSTTYR
jgi:hypothetical protein